MLHVVLPRTRVTKAAGGPSVVVYVRYTGATLGVEHVLAVLFF